MVSDMIDKCIFPDYLLTVVGAMLGLGSAVFILTANIYCAFLKPNNCPQLTWIMDLLVPIYGISSYTVNTNPSSRTPIHFISFLLKISIIRYQISKASFLQRFPWCCWSVLSCLGFSASASNLYQWRFWYYTGWWPC